MNITINRAELLSAVQKAAAIASEDAPLEPLKGVLLEADAAAGTLTLIATNIETSLEQKLVCTIGEDDALVMNAKLLAGMLGLMSGETAQLLRRPGTRVLTLRSGETVSHPHPNLNLLIDGLLRIQIFHTQLLSLFVRSYCIVSSSSQERIKS